MHTAKHWTLACAIGATALAGCVSMPPSSDRPTEPPRVNANGLQSQHWRLQQAFDSRGQRTESWQTRGTTPSSSHTVGLRFLEQQTLAVDRLCNNMNGSYSINGERMEIGRLASTMVACSNTELMALERRVGALLPEVRTWRIQGSNPAVLELGFNDGQRWLLQGTPTHESLHGASERIFWEVAPQTTPCPTSAAPNGQCLQVREVYYNAQSIKSGTGAWQRFAGTIEGYTHQPGMRQVLRLKRFEGPANAQGNKTPIYVHDMTVETETVR